MAKVSSFDKPLPRGDVLQALLEPFDIVLDCTGDDNVLGLLGATWWSIPRLFLSASLGFAAVAIVKQLERTMAGDLRPGLHVLEQRNDDGVGFHVAAAEGL
jgi:hypothetical protein